MHRNPNDDSGGGDDPRVAELVALRSMYPGRAEVCYRFGSLVLVLALCVVMLVMVVAG
jgi:hypothetical protein